MLESVWLMAGQSQDGRAWQMNEIVGAACRLVGSDARVRGVHIVAPGRPTYEELFALREAADASNVRLSVSGERFLTVRRGLGAAATARRHPEERGVSFRAEIRDVVTRFVAPRDDATAPTH